MVELCEERRGLMYQSETATQNISWDDIKKVIKEKGYGQAMMLLPLLFASSEVKYLYVKRVMDIIDELYTEAWHFDSFAEKI